MFTSHFCYGVNFVLPTKFSLKHSTHIKGNILGEKGANTRNVLYCNAKNKVLSTLVGTVLHNILRIKKT